MRLLSRRKSFNSTLVQLKEGKGADKEPSQRSFNSTLVQLKAKSFTVLEYYNALFQFYLSSIKSDFGLWDVCDPRNCFNSTLVQLKVFWIVLTSCSVICFNSTLVQLKGCSCGKYERRY